ncbi:hypothetical protein [Cellulosimicrobium sp. Marseille-Q8652]
MTLDLADPHVRRAHIALTLWGCPRPDKHHFMARADAETALDHYRNHPNHNPTASVYHCPCGGWVWGRRRK